MLTERSGKVSVSPVRPATLANGALRETRREAGLARVAEKLRAAKLAEAEALEELFRLAINTDDNGSPERADELVDAQIASALIGMSLDWLYRNAHRLPFARRVGGRSLRFSTHGIRRWLEVEGRV